MRHTIPAVLRRLIDVFEEQANSDYQSPFICGQLDPKALFALSTKVSAEDRARALSYLRALGMGKGMTEFHTEEEEEEPSRYDDFYNPPAEDLRHRRQAWLSFAAYLYEEGLR